MELSFCQIVPPMLRIVAATLKLWPWAGLDGVKVNVPHWELLLPAQVRTFSPTFIFACRQPIWPAQELSSTFTFTLLFWIAEPPEVVTTKVAFACLEALKDTVLVLVPDPWKRQVAPEGQLLAVNLAFATTDPVLEAVKT